MLRGALARYTGIALAAIGALAGGVGVARGEPGGEPVEAPAARAAALDAASFDAFTGVELGTSRAGDTVLGEVGVRSLGARSDGDGRWLAHWDGLLANTLPLSPWARCGFVSHAVEDHTAITRLVETLFDLPALTARDANSTALLELFDFSCGRDLAVPAAPHAGTGGCAR